MNILINSPCALLAYQINVGNRTISHDSRTKPNFDDTSLRVSLNNSLKYYRHKMLFFELYEN